MSLAVVDQEGPLRTSTLRSWLWPLRHQLPHLGLFVLNWASTPLHEQCVAGSMRLASLVVWHEWNIHLPRSTSLNVCSLLKSTKAGTKSNGIEYCLVMRPTSI